MKTITEIKQHFSDNEIKLCVDIIKGKLEFSVLEEQIKDFYAEENISSYTNFGLSFVNTYK